MYLSNRMPRTISTKPDYSLRWWRKRDLIAPRRATFDILRELVDLRFSQRPPTLKGKVVLGDARRSGDYFQEYVSSIALVVTSPPYIDTTDYGEDQWLRLWFLGGSDTPTLRLHKDDRHTQMDSYWSFLGEAWRGCAPLLRKRATIIIRIGGTKLSKPELLDGLKASLKQGLSGMRFRVLHSGRSSAISKRQTDSFRPGTAAHRVEHDFAFVVS